MNKQIEGNRNKGPATTAYQNPKSERNSGAPTFTKSERAPSPQPAAEKAVFQVPPKGSIKEPSTPILAKDAVNTPLCAANSDDDLMSQEPKQS